MIELGFDMSCYTIDIFLFFQAIILVLTHPWFEGLCGRNNIEFFLTKLLM